MKRIKEKWNTLILVCAIISMSIVTPCMAGEQQPISHARILVISSYAYDWDSVPDQLAGIASVLGNKAKMDYVFMNTKKQAYDDVKEKVRSEIAGNIQADGQYQAVVLEDDAALDFALEYRTDLFENVPLVFEGVNTEEKATKATQDPLITGVVEYFPYHDTIALAEKLYPNATQIVGISDNTESGKGCTSRFYEEETAFPELTFHDLNTSNMTENEIKKTVSTYDDTTILVFLSLMNDADGNTYSLLEATEFVSENAKIPMFKCDYLGVGEGVFGGYVSSYEKMGAAAGEKVLQILSGTAPSDIPVDTMGEYPCFDQKQLDRFGISENLIPKDSVIINYVPTFYEQYRTVIWPAGIAILFLILILIFSLLFYRKRVALREIEMRDKAQVKYLTMTEEKNAQLETAISKAVHASQAKSDFLARMSHEIRTPMNAIIGETMIAQRGMHKPGKVEECLNKIMVSSKHLLSLINDILDMSAIESNKIKIAHAQFDLKEVITTVTTLYYSQCKTKGVEFEAKLGGVDTEILIGDQLRLQQCILNLLSNALKFTEPGGRILFSLEEELQGADDMLLHIKVQDSGCGMNPEYLERIFQPFEQETALTAKEHGGSGLGLSITKNLVEMMGGTIQVESQLGVGSTISFTAKCLVAPDQNRADPSLIQSMRAIVIDDDEDALEYAGDILNHIGIDHDCAGNGEQAIQMITKARNDKRMYNLCLIDWKMGDIDGGKLARWIRKACGEEPIVMIASAYDLNEIRDEVTDAGVDYCIVKPLFQSSVFNILMSLTQGRLVNTTAREEEYDFAGRKLLLADDNELNREIAVELLELVGFQVDVAVDGKDAYEVFTQSVPRTYDAILMDVQMPVMNGYESTEAIRHADHPEAETIPIIAMTANAFAEDIAKSLEAGMNDHVSKPIDTDLLYQVLSRYLPEK